MDSLFDSAAEEATPQPLAVRMRPRTLDEVIGQRHLLGSGTPLRRLVESEAPMSLFLWGPPGTGKTTLAYVVSNVTKRRFVEISAVSAGVKDVRAAIDNARRELGMTGRQTVLFVDEVHRFNKAQQDALLPAVENRWVTFIGATTENPFFSVISPLLSRSLLLTLESLTDDDVRAVLERAVSDPRGLGGRATLSPQALEHLVRLAGGDARRSLTYLEAAALLGDDITVEVVEKAVDKAAVRYDRQGDQHYDVISAFIKSMRGSDADAALHYLARMIEAGEDPRFIARRIVIFASEDVGMADPTCLQTAVAAAQAVQLIGLPEGQINLAQAVIHCATAPKSNAVVKAIGAAVGDVRKGLIGQVPGHLRDAHYPGAAKLGHGDGYKYPHDFEHGLVRQDYAPEQVRDRRYYEPTRHGAEGPVAERWARIRAFLRGA
ncbi:replication-associated recombination protein A [Nonomuraea sp. KC401]|uniref:Replication-associated recombination protein A n=1 Tax=Nonomuraea longispora TaxID=1848320 RepID=A0A4R4N068_9ACTN|nr:MULTISPECIES: replication-associated recombination protein A [Nonomuraea]NBE99450.1 AAA family ATPase [Nonomuraea sp. K271]TDC00230.1 replication-associated recombination protein A [Nonomuraea longispora]TLF57369.1 replication-associated recombination protein A [Nonomuraea sp. KC401]